MSGPCDWPIVGCDECTALESLDPVTRAAVEVAAVEYLWRWSGQVYGACDVIIRPCRRVESRGRTFTGPTTFWPVLIGGEWYNLSCGSCGMTCACTRLCEVVLPGPILSVTQVRVDGAIVPSATYRVDDHTRLVRVGDGNCWPACQNLELPSTAEGTFEVTYKRGVEVPTSGQLAAGALVCEMARAVCGDDDCQLVGRVQTITRQDVTVVLMPPDGEHGLTGIWLVDQFIKSIRAPQPARIVNPDTWLRHRQRTS